MFIRLIMKPVLGGVAGVSLLVMNRLNTTEFAIFVFSDIVLASKGSN